MSPRKVKTLLEKGMNCQGRKKKEIQSFRGQHWSHDWPFWDSNFQKFAIKSNPWFTKSTALCTWYMFDTFVTHIFFSRRRNHSKHFLVRVSLSGRKEGDEHRPESVLFISILYMISVTGLFWEERVFHCVSHTLLWHCFMNASEFEW